METVMDNIWWIFGLIVLSFSFLSTIVLLLVGTFEIIKIMYAKFYKKLQEVQDENSTDRSQERKIKG